MNREEKIDKIANHFGEIMKTLGLDLSDDSLGDSPMRVAKMYVDELCGGLNKENEPKITTFENAGNYNNMLLEYGITVRSMCEHHFVPIFGQVHIAYIPGERIIGLSKFHRVVHYLASQPQVQEKLTQQIADYLIRVLGNPNVAVIVDAKHLCCSHRGVKDVNSATVTSYLGGAFEKSKTRSELFDLIKIRAHQW